jgi:hypothetical protein
MVSTGSRTLKLSILADVDNLKKGLDQSTKEVETFGDKVTNFGKIAGAAFIAAGVAAAAYAGKLAIEGVKAAIEDEAAQIRLATALRGATGATNEQIAAVEKQILKTSLASGVADEILRPALARLSRSTEDVTKAQGLLNLALDISQATGKSVDIVANALGKAYDGNTTALGKLGIGLSSAELKAMSFTEVQGKLTDLFGGASAANAQTFAGRMEILKVTFDEAKESVGAKLLPIIEQLVKFVLDNVIPALKQFAGFFKPITDAIDDNRESFMNFFNLIKQFMPTIIDVMSNGMKIIASVAGGVINVIGSVIGGLSSLISGAVSGINALIKVYNSIPFLPNVSLISAPSISIPTISTPTIPPSSTKVPGMPTVVAGGGGGGGNVGQGASSAFMAQSNAVLADASRFLSSSPSDYSKTSANNAGLITGGTLASNITVNIGVAGDPEGVSREIVNVLNNSYFRGTGGGLNLAGLESRFG